MNASTASTMGRLLEFGPMSLPVATQIAARYRSACRLLDRRAIFKRDGSLTTSPSAHIRGMSPDGFSQGSLTPALLR
jgi:hypothetical protein